MEGLFKRRTNMKYIFAIFFVFINFLLFAKENSIKTLKFSSNDGYRFRVIIDGKLPSDTFQYGSTLSIDTKGIYRPYSILIQYKEEHKDHESYSGQIILYPEFDNYEFVCSEKDKKITLSYITYNKKYFSSTNIFWNNIPYEMKSVAQKSSNTLNFLCFTNSDYSGFKVFYKNEDAQKVYLKLKYGVFEKSYEYDSQLGRNKSTWDCKDYFIDIEINKPTSADSKMYVIFKNTPNYHKVFLQNFMYMDIDNPECVFDEDIYFYKINNVEYEGYFNCNNQKSTMKLKFN